MNEKELEEFLAHFGVLGMKWGVRRDRRNAAVGRAAKDNAALSTRARQIGNLTRQSLTPIGLGITAVDLVGGRGLKGAARRKFNRTAAREKRIHTGQAHVSDYLVHFGSTRLTDLVPVRSSKANRVTSVSDDRRTVAIHGALLVAKILAKQANKAA